MNRLATASNYQASSAIYTYHYDRYGNRWDEGTTGLSVSFNPANNYISSGGYTCDAAGNMTTDGSSSHSYTYDADGNILQVDGGQTAIYVYDAFNHKIRSQMASATLEYIYDYAGRRVSTWNVATSTDIEGRIWGDGTQFAYRGQDGTTYFDHQDYPGTERMRTDYNGNVAYTRTDLPWGDGASSNVVKPSGGHRQLKGMRS